MKRITSLLTALLITFSITSCTKDSDNPDAASDVKTGSKWVYKYTQFNSSGAVTATVNVELLVTGEQTINGQKWWVLSQTGNPTPVILRKATDGWHTVKNNIPQLMFKVPAAMNDTWRVTYSSAAGDYSDFTVKGVNQSLTVPAGTYSVFYAEGFDSNSLEDKVWYDEAHSMIKQQEFDEGPGGVMYMDHQLELVSYTP